MYENSLILYYLQMALVKKDAIIPKDAEKSLRLDLHRSFILKYGDDPDEYEYAMSEFLRMNGLYWGVAAMDLMHSLELMERDKIVQFVTECQDPDTGGFRPVHGHDPHILNTLSAVQVTLSVPSFSGGMEMLYFLFSYVRLP